MKAMKVWIVAFAGIAIKIASGVNTTFPDCACMAHELVTTHMNQDTISDCNGILPAVERASLTLQFKCTDPESCIVDGDPTQAPANRVQCIRSYALVKLYIQDCYDEHTGVFQDTIDSFGYRCDGCYSQAPPASNGVNACEPVASCTNTTYQNDLVWLQDNCVVGTSCSPECQTRSRRATAFYHNCGQNNTYFRNTFELYTEVPPVGCDSFLSCNARDSLYSVDCNANKNTQWKPPEINANANGGQFNQNGNGNNPQVQGMDVGTIVTIVCATIGGIAVLGIGVYCLFCKEPNKSWAVDEEDVVSMEAVQINQKGKGEPMLDGESTNHMDGAWEAQGPLRITSKGNVKLPAPMPEVGTDEMNNAWR